MKNIYDRPNNNKVDKLLRSCANIKQKFNYGENKFKFGKFTNLY